MFRIGASTANLYPLETEQALDILLALGFRTLEVFLNTESELAPDFIAGLRRRIERADARIVSVHPFTSVQEPYLLFSDYDRRLQDGLKLYGRLFDATRELGAQYLVMHGDKPGAKSHLSMEESARRFEQISDVGASRGVFLLQENVCRNRSAELPYLEAMRRTIGEKARFVFDSKQALRSGHTTREVLQALGPNVCHVHISDHTAEHDCMIPGRGCEDFGYIFQFLASNGFDGSVILELYRKNYCDPKELLQGKEFLESIIS